MVQTQVIWLVLIRAVTPDQCHQPTFIKMSASDLIRHYLWWRCVSFRYGISCNFPAIQPLLPQLFHTLNFLLSSSIHTVPSFHNTSSASPLLPRTSSALTWHTFNYSPLLVQHGSSLLLHYSLFPSPLVSSPVSCSVLVSGEKGFSQWEPGALVPVLSDFFFPTSLSLPLSLCLSLSLTVTWIGSVETTPSHWTR